MSCARLPCGCRPSRPSPRILAIVSSLFCSAVCAVSSWRCEAESEAAAARRQANLDQIAAKGSAELDKVDKATGGLVRSKGHSSPHGERRATAGLAQLLTPLKLPEAQPAE